MRKNIMRTPEEKEAIVKEYFDSKLSIRGTAAKYGTETSVVRRWIKKYRLQGIDGLISKTGKAKGKKSGRKKKNRSEIDVLQEKLLKLEIENARLKKGYAVKGVGAKKEFVTTFGKNTK